MSEIVRISHTNVPGVIVQIDWAPSRDDTDFAALGDYVGLLISGLDISASSADDYSDFSRLSGRKRGERSVAVSEICDWLSLGIRYCDQVLNAENLHAPYLGFLYRILVQRETISFAALIERQLATETVVEGETDLYCHRVTSEQYALFYSTPDEWQEWAEETIELGATPLEELIRTGRAF